MTQSSRAALLPTGMIGLALGSFMLCCDRTPLAGGAATYLEIVAQADHSLELEGTWIEVLEDDPHVARRRTRAPLILVVSGPTFVEKLTDRTVRESLLRKVPGQRGAIDLMTVVDGEFWLTRAIYKVEEDTLAICEATRDADRPTEFRPQRRVGVALTMLRRFQRIGPGRATPATRKNERRLI